LLDAYGGSCAITGCNLALILEAAHVFPYKGAHTNVVGNGILLRTDIHTLFDLRLIAIDPDTRLILVSPDLDGTDYESLRGKTIRDAAKKSHRVSLDALKWHRAQCVW
jgi:predicted restriction endonuclease